MRFLITSGLGTRDVGGHSQYATNLTREFTLIGHEVESDAYNSIEKKLPLGIRHIYFFLKILSKVFRADAVLTLDSFSVGIPSLLASKLFNKKIIARIGGDFLWETYVNESGHKLTISEFYKALPKLSLKQKIIHRATRYFTKHIDHIVYNSEFQRKIWGNVYSINSFKTSVIYNFIPLKIASDVTNSSIFIWAGRDIPLKNVSILIDAVKEINKTNTDLKLEVITNQPRETVMEKIKKSRAAVLPSLSEMSPNFLIEAITLGKPFICTKESGLSELYREGGIYIDPHNQKELEEAIIEMMDDNKYQEFVNILNNTDKTHTWDTIAKEYLNILCH